MSFLISRDCERLLPERDGSGASKGRRSIAIRIGDGKKESVLLTLCFTLRIQIADRERSDIVRRDATRNRAMKNA
jgi:hypothetical protein